MKENHLAINIVDEDNVNIEANFDSRVNSNHYETKEFGYTTNSLNLSKTLSSDVKTMRISRNSASMSNVMLDSVQEVSNYYQLGPTPDKECFKLGKINGFSNEKRLTYFKKSEELSSSDKIPSESDENSQKRLKINNFIGKATNMRESENAQTDLNNTNVVVQSCSQTFIINQTLKSYHNNTRLEITNKSIFYTPSTICNYYQQSENDCSPSEGNNLIIISNNLPSMLMNDAKNSSSAKSQIKYTKDQLQSSEKTVYISNSRKNDNQFTVGYMRDLVKEIKKELVLNISTLEDEYTFEEKNDVKAFNNVDVKRINSDGILVCSNEINIELTPLVKTVKFLGIESLNPYANIKAQRNINFSVIPSDSLLVKKTQSANEEFICKNTLNPLKSSSVKNTLKKEKACHSNRKEIKNAFNRIPHYKRNNLHLQNIAQKNTINSELPKNTDTVKNASKGKLSINSGEIENSSVKNLYVEILKKSQNSSNPASKKKFNNNNGKEIPTDQSKSDKTLTQLNSTKNKSPPKNLLKFVNTKKNEYSDIIQALSGSYSTQSKRNSDFLIQDSKSSKKTLEVTIDLSVQKTLNNQQNEINDKNSQAMRKSVSKKDKINIPKTTRDICTMLNKENCFLKSKLATNIDRLPVRGLNTNKSRVSLVDKKNIGMKPPQSIKRSEQSLNKQKKVNDINNSIKFISEEVYKISSGKNEKIKIIEDYNVPSKLQPGEKTLISKENKENYNNMNNQIKMCNSKSS